MIRPVVSKPNKRWLRKYGGLLFDYMYSRNIFLIDWRFEQPVPRLCSSASGLSVTRRLHTNARGPQITSLFRSNWTSCSIQMRPKRLSQPPCRQPPGMRIYLNTVTAARLMAASGLFYRNGGRVKVILPVWLCPEMQQATPNLGDQQS